MHSRYTFSWECDGFLITENFSIVQEYSQWDWDDGINSLKEISSINLNLVLV